MVCSALSTPWDFPRQPRARQQPTTTETATCSSQPPHCPILAEIPSLDSHHLSSSESHHLPGQPKPSLTTQLWTSAQPGHCAWPQPPTRETTHPHTGLTAHSLSSGLGEARMALCFLFTSSTFSEILSMKPRISSTCEVRQEDRWSVTDLDSWKLKGLLYPIPKQP